MPVEPSPAGRKSTFESFTIAGENLGIIIELGEWVRAAPA